MRTTIDIPEKLLKEAMRASDAKTKTMAIILGLKELLNREKIEQLRKMSGKLNLSLDINKARKR